MELLKKNGLDGRDPHFYFSFLDRLRSDCEYYLGCGGRYSRHLWTRDEYEHIALMRAIYNLLPVKPAWLTLEQIEDYADRMLLWY